MTDNSRGGARGVSDISPFFIAKYLELSKVSYIFGEK